MENPFAVVGEGDDETLAGRHADASMRHQDSASLSTTIAVCGDKHGNAIAVMSLKGTLWEPQVGAVVQLAEPNRDATVCSVRYGVGPDGDLHAVVYLDDPATTNITLPKMPSARPRRIR